MQVIAEPISIPETIARHYVTSRDSASRRYAGRRNMWDTVGNVEAHEAPPPFAERSAPPQPAPRSPPPAYDATLAASVHADQTPNISNDNGDDHDDDNDDDNDDNDDSEELDEFTRQERIAWEADRVAGISVHVRVARSAQRRAEYERRQQALPVPPPELQVPRAPAPLTGEPAETDNLPSPERRARQLPEWERRPQREDSDSDESIFANSDEERDTSAAASTDLSASGGRPLPQPPASRERVVSAREQLQDEGVVRQLGLAVQNHSPLTPSQLTRASTIRGMPLQRGASVRAARSSAAPPPRQLHLPAVTEATRHFPATEVRAGSDTSVPATPITSTARTSSEGSRRESVIEAAPPLREAQPYPAAGQQDDENVDITDLELATALLDDPNYRFESAAMLTEFLGPAAPGALLTESERADIPVGRVEGGPSGRSIVGVSVDNCGICLSELATGEMACILPCVHMCVYVLTRFHDGCTAELLRNSRVCPLCRRDIGAHM